MEANRIEWNDVVVVVPPSAKVSVVSMLSIFNAISTTFIEDYEKRLHMLARLFFPLLIRVLLYCAKVKKKRKTIQIFRLANVYYVLGRMFVMFCMMVI